MTAGAELLVKTVNGLAANTIIPVPQEDIPAGALKHASKIFKEDTRIDWQKPVREVHDLVRGMSPYPAAFTELAGKNIKLYQTHFSEEATGEVPGSYDTDHKTYLRFAAADGWLYVDELQQEGKKRMDTEAFLRGFRH